jgi:hypothetical protein
MSVRHPQVRVHDAIEPAPTQQVLHHGQRGLAMRDVPGIDQHGVCAVIEQHAIG